MKMNMKTIDLPGYCLALLVVLSGCTRGETELPPEPEELTAVHFAAPELPVTVLTRAGDTGTEAEPLPEGTTLRLRAYRRSAAAPEVEVDFATADPEAELTCRVGVDGMPVAWEVTDAGQPTGTAGTGEIMYLRKGIYDFYAVSPAIRPVKTDGNWRIEGLGHRTDVMTSSRMGVTVGDTSPDPVVLDPFIRRCAQVVFTVKPDFWATDIYTLKGTSLYLQRLSCAPAVLPVAKDGSIVPSYSSDPEEESATLDFKKKDFMELEPPEVTSNKTKAVILPKAKAPFDITIGVERNGERATLYATLDNITFEAGNSYVFTLTVTGASSGTLDLRIFSWERIRFYDNQVGTPSLPGLDPGDPDINTGVGTGGIITEWKSIRWEDNNVGGK